MANKLYTAFQKKGVMGREAINRGEDRSTSVNSFSLQSSPVHFYLVLPGRKKKVPIGLRVPGKDSYVHDLL